MGHEKWPMKEGGRTNGEAAGSHARLIATHTLFIWEGGRGKGPAHLGGKITKNRRNKNPINGSKLFVSGGGEKKLKFLVYDLLNPSRKT